MYDIVIRVSLIAYITDTSESALSGHVGLLASSGVGRRGSAVAGAGPGARSRGQRSRRRRLPRPNVPSIRIFSLDLTKLREQHRQLVGQRQASKTNLLLGQLDTPLVPRIGYRAVSLSLRT